MEFQRKYSCNTATETLEWIKAILDFLKPFKFFFEANVVNFLKVPVHYFSKFCILLTVASVLVFFYFIFIYFQSRLWDFVDKDWIECLKHEPVENLLQIPSGIVQVNPIILLHSLLI